MLVRWVKLYRKPGLTGNTSSPTLMLYRVLQHCERSLTICFRPGYDSVHLQRSIKPDKRLICCIIDEWSVLDCSGGFLTDSRAVSQKDKTVLIYSGGAREQAGMKPMSLLICRKSSTFHGKWILEHEAEISEQLSDLN